MLLRVYSSVGERAEVETTDDVGGGVACADGDESAAGNTNGAGARSADAGVANDDNVGANRGGGGE